TVPEIEDTSAADLKTAPVKAVDQSGNDTELDAKTYTPTEPVAAPAAPAATETAAAVTAPEPAPPQQEVAQNEPPKAQEPEPAQAQPAPAAELPHTGSPVPLIGLLGILSLAAFGVSTRFSRVR
ncbi:MAG: LPXTG cell wall anchor domain-containing protein, partial [Bryobacteraceae bacterium]